jgi:ADP-ribosylglycohydrolase
VKKNPLLKEKIYGCLLGVAAGDAMGMPTAMMNPDVIRKIFKKYVDDFLPAPPNHSIHNHMQAGQITDDTQQTLVIADSILTNHAIIPSDIARRLIAWCESVNAFDSFMLGPSSSRSLLSIKHGKRIEEAGLFGDTNGWHLCYGRS